MWTHWQLAVGVCCPATGHARVSLTLSVWMCMCQSFCPKNNRQLVENAIKITALFLACARQLSERSKKIVKYGSDPSDRKAREKASYNHEKLRLDQRPDCRATASAASCHLRGSARILRQVFAGRRVRELNVMLFAIDSEISYLPRIRRVFKTSLCT